MWGDETQAGPEEQSPRDQSKGRMRHETKYPLLEDCGKTKQREWSSVTSWSWPCVLGEASRLLLHCEEADRFCSMGVPRGGRPTLQSGKKGTDRKPL